jgi:DNA-binding CsgD family transcriptional regulator
VELEHHVAATSLKRMRQGLHPLEIFGAWQAVRCLLESSFADEPAALKPLELAESALVDRLRTGLAVRRPDAWPKGEVRRLRIEAERLAVGLEFVELAGSGTPHALGEGQVLTRREREVVGLASGGMTTDEIANTMHLSPATVRTYLSRAEKKLGARNRTHAVALAVGRGIVVLPAASTAGRRADRDASQS